MGAVPAAPIAPPVSAPPPEPVPDIIAPENNAPVVEPVALNPQPKPVHQMPAVIVPDVPDAPLASVQSQAGPSKPRSRSRQMRPPAEPRSSRSSRLLVNGGKFPTRLSTIEVPLVQFRFHLWYYSLTFAPYSPTFIPHIMYTQDYPVNKFEIFCGWQKQLSTLTFRSVGQNGQIKCNFSWLKFFPANSYLRINDTYLNFLCSKDGQHRA